MTTHELKTWLGPFRDVLDGRKRFELRQNDRGFAVGDELLLREYDLGQAAYTGRQLLVRVVHMLESIVFGLREGYVCMSIEDIDGQIPRDDLLESYRASNVYLAARVAELEAKIDE